MLSSHLLPADHLDLLVSAGFAFDLVANPTTAAFGPRPGFFAARSADELGRLLQQQNLAAVQWLTRLGQTRLADRQVPQPYRHRPVSPELLDPVEVLKACQAYEYFCNTSPQWPASRAREFVSTLTAAAIRRVPGYAESPWLWTRPPARRGPAIAYGGQWRPPIEGMTWLSRDALVAQWSSAQLVAVTVDVVLDLPAGLPHRPAVFVLTHREIPEEVWEAAEALAPDGILFYPVCGPWLAERLAVDRVASGSAR